MFEPMQVRSYELRRRLGAGGMAEVFEAVAERDDGTSERVAIKRVLREHADDPEFVRWFLDEARVHGRVTHTNVLPLLDAGTLDGVPFQCLRFVDGLDAGALRQRAGPLPTSVVLYLGTCVARGLHAAHTATSSRGEPLRLVHRDVSPANVLVSWEGEVYLADFGIAFAADRSERTALGVVKGKSAYMAPEQVGGLAVDARADVFALGCTLHALCTGRSPVSTVDALSSLMAGVQPEADAAIDGPLRAIVARAIALRADERYPSAEAMADALDAARAEHGDAATGAGVRRWLAPFRSGVESSTSPASDGATRAARIANAAAPSASLFLLDPFGGGAPRERSFVTAAARPTPVAAATAGPPSATKPADAEAPPVVESAAPLASSAPRERRSMRAIAAAILAGAAVPAVIVSARAARSPAATPTATNTSRPVEGVRTVARVAPRTTEVLPALSSPPIASTVAPEPSLPPPRHSTAARSVGAAPRAPSSASAGPTADAIEGVLIVAGERALGATVSLDGRPRGLALQYLRVPVGPHTLVARRPDGETLGPRSVDVQPQHTRIRPLEVDFDR